MTDAPTIGCIVEGDGEERAVPHLLRRIIDEQQPWRHVRVRLSRRINRGRLVQIGGIERWVEEVAREIGRSGAIFVLMDADDDCPATLGPELLGRARQARSDLPISIVLAKREYEAWFLASAKALSGKRDLPANLHPPTNPENIRDAKGWLGKQMPAGRKYSEVIDQPALTAMMDLHAARTAESFDKCYREVARLVALLTAEPMGTS